MTTRAFIAYDFALSDRGSFMNVLEDAREIGKPDLQIDYPGATDAAKDHGALWDVVVGKYIDACERFLAYIDLPNANVGFEIGYAFGKNKPVGIYRFGLAEHSWLKKPPLFGHIRHMAKTAEAICQAIRQDGFMEAQAPPPAGKRVLLLCPKEGGEPFRRQVDTAWGWTMDPPLSEWTVDRLPEQFQDVGCVVWIVTPHDGDPEKDRDGAENTALSMIAGYAHACHPDMELHVLVHKKARNMADRSHVSKPFETNSALKKLLAGIQTAWQAKLQQRRAAAAEAKARAQAKGSASTAPSPPKAAVPTVPSSKPAHVEPHPHDPFPAALDRFIGREAQLGAGADAVEGLVERFKTRTSSERSRAIQLIWAHGFGGMGKSWRLQHTRCLAEQEHPHIRSLIVDWDKPEWLAPLTGEPRAAEEVFDLLATRLCQRLGPDAADLYYEAKDRARASAEPHKRALDRFETQLQLALTGSGASVEAHLLQRLRAENLWHEDPARRERNFKSVRENAQRHRDLFVAWCHDTGEQDPAVICPRRELAEGLRAALRRAMEQHPLIVVLDTCEVLSDELHYWLRELFVPLLRESAPLLLLIGSRLRPDLLQPRGGRRGWLLETPSVALRVEDFGEVLRFQVDEIEVALGQLRRPLRGEPGPLAEALHPRNPWRAPGLAWPAGPA